MPVKPFRFYFLVLLSFLGHLPSAVGQETLLYFSWDNSVADPDIGPDGLVATTVSPYVTIDAGGANGTNGLSAGLRPGGSADVTGDKANIHLVVPTHASFNVDGIDISLDYQRDESAGTLVSRGADFIFGTAEGAQVSYRLQDPGEGNVTSFSSPVYALDLDDNLFHTLRFVYDPNTGEAQLSIDGAVVWEPEVTTPGQTLYWEETADILIGYDIDGAGYNRPVIDNFSLGSIPLTVLPVGLQDFTARATPSGVRLSWETTYEQDLESFRVQRMEQDGKWVTLDRLPGAGQPLSGSHYYYLDPQPLLGVNYYRLAQVDLSGATTFSPVRTFRHDLSVAEGFAAYPNPTSGLVEVAFDRYPERIRISDAHGRDKTDAVGLSRRSATTCQIDLRALPAGWYAIQTPAGSRYVLKR